MSKIGLFAIGLDVYWDQFEGLKERLHGYLSVVEERLSGRDVEIINIGMIDDEKKAAHVYSALS